MAGNVIHVFKDSSGKYRVWPPVLIVGRGKTARLQNVTGETAEVNLAVRRWPSLPLQGKTSSFTVQPGKSGRFTVAKKTKKGLVYHYVVMVDGKKAKGFSDPSIIVD